MIVNLLKQMEVSVKSKRTERILVTVKVQRITKSKEAGSAHVTLISRNLMIPVKVGKFALKGQ